MIREVYAYTGEKKIRSSVAEEIDLRLIVNGRSLAAVKLSPQYLEEFALGYCLSEGFVKGIDSVRSIRIEGKNAVVEADASFDVVYERYLSSDCISGWRTRIEEESIFVSSKFKLSAKELLTAMRELQKRSEVWKKTGGVHSAGLACGEDFVIVEDVSRHVAIDKVLGIAAKRGLDFGKSFMLCSGRLPGDIVIKVARMGVPILASRTAPIFSGVECAIRTNLTLVGFIRGTRMNVYSHPERIEW